MAAQTGIRKRPECRVRPPGDITWRQPGFWEFPDIIHWALLGREPSEDSLYRMPSSIRLLSGVPRLWDAPDSTLLRLFTQFPKGRFYITLPDADDEMALPAKCWLAGTDG